MLITRHQHKHGGSFKDVVNAALRVGLAELAKPTPRRNFRTAAVSLGRPFPGSLDNVADVLAATEGEQFA